jgi:hypothetical protein
MPWLRRCAYGSGRSVIREPAGKLSAEAYFPVSHRRRAG